MFALAHTSLAEAGEDGFALIGHETGSVGLGVGAFNIIKRDALQPEARIEITPGIRLFSSGPYFKGFGPLVGLMVNTDGSVFGYGAGFYDFRVGRRIAIRPQFGIGGYEEGGGVDLGGVFQFHLGISGSYRFDNGHRLGALFAHISNNGIHKRNPGNNSVLLTYSIPFDWGF